MESDIKIKCETHGESDAAFVCQHLFKGERLGFNWSVNEEKPDAWCPDAWCNECDSGLSGAGEWTDELTARADIKLVCTSCYGVIREKNWIQDEVAYRKLCEESMSYLKKQQQLLWEKLGIGGYDRYDYDQDRAQLIFSSNGKPGVVCDVTFVGSIAPRPGTWLWSWANNSLTAAVQARMREVRAYGEQHSFHRLAGALWNADETDGWEVTAIATYLLKGLGAYRAPDEKSKLFMVILNATRAQ